MFGAAGLCYEELSPKTSIAPPPNPHNMCKACNDCQFPVELMSVSSPKKTGLWSTALPKKKVPHDHRSTGRALIRANYDSHVENEKSPSKGPGIARFVVCVSAWSTRLIRSWHEGMFSTATGNELVEGQNRALNG